MIVELDHMEAGSGRPVVLLHAFPLSRLIWSRQLLTPPEGWRLIAPDLRGFGSSAGTHSGDLGAPSVDAMADDVAALLDKLGLGEVVLGGLSMGGYVAMAFLRRHPGRVDALVLADTKAGADPEAGAAKRLAMAARLEEEDTTEALLEDVVPNLLGATTKRRFPEIATRVAGMAKNCDPLAAAWAQRAMAARPDSFDTLRAADIPALVIVGEEDVLSPTADAEAMAEALPRADKPVVIPAAGHLTSVEKPGKVNAALYGFLATLP
jgi:pimeloyl-ACP methyl ester carboxylesterase